MTLYRYKAVGKGGTLVRGTVDVDSQRELYVYLNDIGLSPIGFYSVRRLPGASFFERPIRIRSLRELCLQLEQCENAGIPLKESLEEITKIQDSPKLKTILTGIGKELEAGILLSTALEKYPQVFDSVFVGIIRVGEKTGHLSVAFRQLAHHLKWVDEVQAQVVKALRYPMIIVMLLCAVTYTLLTIMIPELVNFIKNTAVTLPFSTRLLMTISFWFSHYVVILILVGVSGLGLMTAVFKLHPKGVWWKSRIQASLPFVGALQAQLALVRFCHLFALLFGSGIDILQALQTARESLNPGKLPHALRCVEHLVREGHSLSSAFEKAEAFPPMVVRMIRIGEQTSALGENLLHVKEYVDTAFKRKVDHIVSLIEPATILVMGLFMGWIVYAIFLPLYDTLMILDC